MDPEKPETDLKPELDVFREMIRHLSCDDFDGHTCFCELTAEEKLNWLSQVVQFYFDHSKATNIH